MVKDDYKKITDRDTLNHLLQGDIRLFKKGLYEIATSIYSDFLLFEIARQTFYQTVLKYINDGSDYTKLPLCSQENKAELKKIVFWSNRLLVDINTLNIQLFLNPNLSILSSQSLKRNDETLWLNNSFGLVFDFLSLQTLWVLTKTCKKMYFLVFNWQRVLPIGLLPIIGRFSLKRSGVVNRDFKEMLSIEVKEEESLEAVIKTLKPHIDRHRASLMKQVRFEEAVRDELLKSIEQQEKLKKSQSFLDSLKPGSDELKSKNNQLTELEGNLERNKQQIRWVDLAEDEIKKQLVEFLKSFAKTRMNESPRMSRQDLWAKKNNLEALKEAFGGECHPIKLLSHK